MNGLLPRLRVGNQVGLATLVEFISVAVIGAKTEPCSLDGCPMFAPAYMGRKRRGASPFKRFCYVAKKTATKSKSPCAWSESIGRIRFRPMYAEANMGHPER
jgi:hypothetical protein